MLFSTSPVVFGAGAGGSSSCGHVAIFVASEQHHVQCSSPLKEFAKGFRSIWSWPSEYIPPLALGLSVVIQARLWLSLMLASGQPKYDWGASQSSVSRRKASPFPDVGFQVQSCEHLHPSLSRACSIKQRVQTHSAAAWESTFLPRHLLQGRGYIDACTACLIFILVLLQ